MHNDGRSPEKCVLPTCYTCGKLKDNDARSEGLDHMESMEIQTMDVPDVLISGLPKLFFPHPAISKYRKHKCQSFGIPTEPQNQGL